MGTKLKPGAFDCYANAAPDEPMFVLLARDPHAPFLVESWAARREEEGESAMKVAEARECARSMREYRAELLRKRRVQAENLAYMLGIEVSVCEAAVKACGDDGVTARDVLAFAKKSNVDWAEVLMAFRRFARNPK